MKNSQKIEKVGVWYALSLAWQLGYTIAIPIVFLALLGRFLDVKLNSSPWLLLAGIFVSLLISSWTVYIKTVKILADAGKGKKEEL